MLIKVGKFIFPVDFVVIDIEEEKQVPTAVRNAFLSNISSFDRCEKRIIDSQGWR